MSDQQKPAILKAIQSSRRELARLLTRIENAEAPEALAVLYPYTGNAHIVGVTGAPGTGKSSLVSALARHYRAIGQSVGVVAVDPTSPFSGGAVLGDRIRMRDLSGDPGVFIRSMATRGSLGGLARATGDVVRALDAAGFDLIFVETVGAGQGEVEIARMAETTLVVEAPGLGDDVQAIKAGILEIADILVVNKADRPGAENTVRALRAMLDLGHRTERLFHHGRAMTTPAAEPPVDETAAWQTPIVKTNALDNIGIPALVGHIAAHRKYLHASGVLRWHERRRIETEIADRLRDTLLAALLEQVDPSALGRVVESVLKRELDPASAVQHLLGLARQAEQPPTSGSL